MSTTTDYIKGAIYVARDEIPKLGAGIGIAWGGNYILNNKLSFITTLGGLGLFVWGGYNAYKKIIIWQDEMPSSTIK